MYNLFDLLTRYASQNRRSFNVIFWPCSRRWAGINEFEHVTQEGISLDLADPENKRAIEVDGPSHYLKNVSTGEYVVNGATQFKSRLLRALGWQITHVPFFGWYHKTRSERRELLRNHLAKIGVTQVEPGSSP